MSERGVFAVDRGVFDHPLLDDGQPFTRREAWLWMISEAEWKPVKRQVGSSLVSLVRGQFAHSIRFLAEAWHWPKSNVARFLDRLKTGTMIGTDTGTGVLIVTICNYDAYQKVSLPKRDSSGTHSGTASGQQRDRLEDSESSEDKDTSLRSVAPSAPKPSEQMVELRKVLDEEHAKAVIDHRKGFKGRFTARAAILLASKFGRCPDANAAADAMISNNWMGFEPEWLENRKASARASPAAPLRGLAAIEERLKRDIENEQRINSTPSHDGEIDAGFPFLAIADHRGHY